MSHFKILLGGSGFKNYDIKCKEMQPDRFLPGQVFIFYSAVQISVYLTFMYL